MAFDRRQIVLGGLGISVDATALPGPREAAAGSAGDRAMPAGEFGITPDTDSDQTRALQRAIDVAAPAGMPLHLPAGRYRVGELRLRPGLALHGVPGRTVLAYAGNDAFLIAEGAEALRLHGLILDGGNWPLAGSEALLLARECSGLSLRDCRVEASSGHGVALHGCSGEVIDCDISGARQTGLFSIDAAGLEIHHNHVHDCANNGIQVWRSAQGEDATIVAHNRIEHIRTEAGGEGQNGNGVNIFRAGSVLVAGNRIADCAFSAIRANAGPNCQMIGNSCARLGEVALYAEFGFEGAIIANNLVEAAAAGISITNFNEGGRLAVAQGNLIRNLFLRDHYEPRGFGIGVEADTLVTGNVVEGAPAVGISVGWGRYLREVSVTANIVRRARIGIGVSAAAGAGNALISNNMISGSEDGAIRAMVLGRAVGADLAAAGARDFPNILLRDNVAL